MHFATPSYRTVKNRAVAAEEPGILICERQRLRKPNRLPSDIKPESFATALIGVVALDRAGKHAFELTAAEVRETVAKIDPNNPVRGLLLRTARRRLVRCRNGPGRGLVQAAGDLAPAGGGGGQKADQQGSGVDHAGVSPALRSTAYSRSGFGAAGIELSLRSGWFALTSLIFLPLLRRLRRGADADLFDVAALPALVAPMFGLPAVDILGDARVHNPVAKLVVVLVRSPAGRHGCPTSTPWSI